MPYEYFESINKYLISRERDFDSFIRDFYLKKILPQNIELRGFVVNKRIAMVMGGVINCDSGIKTIVLPNDTTSGECKNILARYNGYRGGKIKIEYIKNKKEYKFGDILQKLLDSPIDIVQNLLSFLDFDTLFNIFLLSGLKVSEMNVMSRRGVPATKNDEKVHLSLLEVKNKSQYLLKEKAKIKGVWASLTHIYVLTESGIYSNEHLNDFGVGEHFFSGYKSRIPEHLRARDIGYIKRGVTHRIISTSKGNVLSYSKDSYHVVMYRLPNYKKFWDLFSSNGEIIDIDTQCAHIVALGRNHIYTSGDNGDGQLGVDTTLSSNLVTPALPAGIAASEIKHVRAGFGNTFVYNSKLICSTGANEFGQLGLEDVVNRSSFNIVILPKATMDRKIISVSLGEGHTVVHTNEAIYAFGNNQSGQLGRGYTSIRGISPMKIELPEGITIDDVVDVKACIDHTLVHTRKGLYACGDNALGQLGLGNSFSVSVLTKSRFDEEIFKIEAGGKATIIHAKSGVYLAGMTYGLLKLEGVVELYTDTFAKVISPDTYTLRDRVDFELNKAKQGLYLPCFHRNLASYPSILKGDNPVGGDVHDYPDLHLEEGNDAGAEPQQDLDSSNYIVYKKRRIG